MHILFCVTGGASWSVFALMWSALGIMILIFILAWNVFSNSRETDPRDEFKKYVALVHERYDTGVDDVIFPWLPLTMMKNYYVNLTLVKDQEHGMSMEDDDRYSSQLHQMKEKAAGLEQLFNAEIRTGDRVLVRGPPGVGKTKLCEVLRTKWNEGTLLKSCEVLIHIPLRKLTVINNPNLSDLLNFAGELPLNTSYGLEKWLKSKEGLPLCFLLDGIDEYRQGYNNHSNYIYKLVVGDELVRSTVIITSRPRHSWHFRNRVTTNVIILGFDDVSTAQFVRTYFKLTFQPQKATALLNYFQDHYHITSLCHTPLHLMMTVFVYHKSGKLPDTESQMFKFFILSAFLWDYCKLSSTSEEDCMDSQWSDISDLPDTFQTMALQLSSLAFQGVLNSQSVFTKEDVQSNLALLKCNLSIVIVDREYCGFDCVPLMKTLSFPIFTIQEFLAAYHLTTLSTERQMEVIRTYPDELRFTEVWKFYCGISGPSEKFLKYFEILNLKYMMNEQYSIPLTGHEVWPFLLSARCAFEAQSFEASLKLMDCLNGSVQIDHRLIGHMLLPSDSVSFKFVLNASCNNFHELTYFPSYSYGPYNMDLKGVYNLLQTLKDLGPVLQLSTFRAINGPLEDTVVKQFIANLLSSLPSLKRVEVWTSICIFGKYKSDSVLVSPGNVQLGESLRSLPYLTNLTFGCIGVGDVGIEAIVSATPKPVRLSSIELWGNGITDKGAQALSRLLKRAHIVVLNLCNNFLHNKGTGAIATSLNVSSHSCLQELDLGWNMIKDEGVFAIVETLKHCSRLRILRLDYNYIGNKGARYIAQLIEKLTNIEVVSLQGNMIGYSGATSLLKAAAESLNLRVLDLSSNEINLDNKYILSAQQFQRIRGSHYPFMSCSIDVDPVCVNSNLSYRPRHGLFISLANNRVTDEGVAYVLSQKILLRVTEINLDDNYISNKGTQTLAKFATMKACVLERLSLCGNGIEYKGASVLANAFMTSPSLCYLKLNSNNFGDDGLRAFAEALTAEKPIMKETSIAKRVKENNVWEIHLLTQEVISQEATFLLKSAAATLTQQIANISIIVS